MKLSLGINISTYLLATLISPLFTWGQTEETQPKSIDAEQIETAISPTTPITNTPPVIIKRFEGLLDNVHDQTPIEQDMTYNILLNYVNRFSAEEISNKVKPEITYNALMNSPEKIRGEFIRCQGVLLYLNPYRLKTNPAGVDIYYAGMIANLSKNEFYRFHLINKPNESLRSLDDDRSFADEVEIEGAFLKIAQYEIDPKFGEGYRYAPFIIGKKIARIIHPVPKAAKTFQFLIGIIAGIILISLFLYIIISGHKKNQAPLSRIKAKPQTSPNNKSGDKTC
jgi:hypothetical protein